MPGVVSRTYIGHAIRGLQYGASELGIVKVMDVPLDATLFSPITAVPLPKNTTESWLKPVPAIVTVESTSADEGLIAVMCGVDDFNTGVVLEALGGCGR